MLLTSEVHNGGVGRDGGKVLVCFRVACAPIANGDGIRRGGQLGMKQDVMVQNRRRSAIPDRLRSIQLSRTEFWFP